MGASWVNSAATHTPDPAEPELADDSYLLSALLESTTDNIYFKDIDSHFVRINRTQAKFLGLSDPSEAIGKSDLDYFADQHSHEARQDEIEIIRLGQPLVGKEEREDWPDGAVSWASTSKMPLFNGEGRCIGTFGISRDITNRKRDQQALLESEARFKDLTNAIREVFWILDIRNKKTLYVSRAYEEIWGRPCEQLYADIGDWLSAVHPDDRALVEARYSEKVDRPFEITFRILRGDGEVRWIRSRGFPITGGDGELLRLVGIAADFTEARLASQELAKTQNLLASIVTSSPDAIMSQARDGRILTWNPSAERMFGYSPAEAIGSTLKTLLASDLESNHPWVLDHIRQGLSVQEFKAERRHKDGSMVAVSISISPVRDETGEIVGMSAQYHNISERKKLENKLSAVSEQLRALLDTMNEYVIALDLDWHITYQNRRHDGADPSTVVGETLWKCLPYLLGTSFEQEARRAMSERKPCRFEEYVGAWKAWITGMAYPTETGLLILAKDETEKRALDNQLRSAQKMEAIGQLAAGIAHEINTPIQYVGDNTRYIKESWGQVAELLSAAQKLRDEAASGVVSPATVASFDACSKRADIEYLTHDVPRAIDETLEGVQSVAKIVKAMKEFSHPGSNEKRAVDLNRAIETTITVSRNEWKYVADVETHLDPNLPLVPCLAGELNQVLLNLIVNAAHAIADVVKNANAGHGLITLSTRREGNFVEFSVGDTGTGIPDSVSNRVFDPFFTTKEMGKGTGQGLTLAHVVVVKKHSGRIWFDTEVGKGTTFYVRLPLSEGVENQLV